MLDSQDQRTHLPQLPAKAGVRNPFAVRAPTASAKAPNPFAVPKFAAQTATRMAPLSMSSVPAAAPPPASPPTSPSTKTNTTLENASGSQPKHLISSRQAPDIKIPTKVPPGRTRPANTPESSSSEEDDALAVADTPTSSQIEQENDDDPNDDIDEFSSQPEVHPPTPYISPPHREKASGKVRRDIQSHSPDISIQDGYYIPPSRSAFIGKPSSAPGKKVSAKAGKARALERVADEMDVDVPAATTRETEERMAVDDDARGDQANQMTIREQTPVANSITGDPDHRMTGQDLPAVAHPVLADTPGGGSSNAPDAYNPPPRGGIRHISADRQHSQDSLPQKVCDLVKLVILFLTPLYHQESWTISPGSFAAYHLVNASIQLKMDLDRSSAVLRDLMKVERALKDASMHANDALQRLDAWKDE
jgi:hypothetical protein